MERDACVFVIKTSALVLIKISCLRYMKWRGKNEMRHMELCRLLDAIVLLSQIVLGRNRGQKFNHLTIQDSIIRGV